MDLLESILSAKGGSAVGQLASQFGLREDQAKSAIQSLVPALTGGLQRNINQGGLEDLIGALTNGAHERFVDDPSTLSSETVREEGNGILGHLLGSKDVSRQVAAHASQRTGISESILKQMLPAVAALAMGVMRKQAGPSLQSPLGGGPASGGAGILGMLTPLLDRNRDGSIADDILGSVSSFFKK